MEIFGITVTTKGKSVSNPLDDFPGDYYLNTMDNETVKVLWPDGPRMVSAYTIQMAASDALANEEEIDRAPGDIPLEEAIEIVNNYGYYTTAKA